MLGTGDKGIEQAVRDTVKATKAMVADLFRPKDQTGQEGYARVGGQAGRPPRRSQGLGFGRRLREEFDVYTRKITGR